MDLPVLGYLNGGPPWLALARTKEGFFMAGIADSSHSRSNSFQKVVAAFLAQPGLPFAEVLSAERIERVFAKHGNLFGLGAIYSTALVVVCRTSASRREGSFVPVRRGSRRELLSAAGNRPAHRRHGRLLQGASQVVGSCLA